MTLNSILMPSLLSLEEKWPTIFVQEYFSTDTETDVQNAYQVLMILAGYNVLTKKPTLNWIDNLGTRAAVPYCAHGYGAYYTMSIFDRYHREDINYEEGVDIIRKCIFELDKRLPISSCGYL